MIIKIDGLNPDSFAALAAFLASKDNRPDEGDLFLDSETNGDIQQSFCILSSSKPNPKDAGLDVVLKVGERYGSRVDRSTQPTSSHRLIALLESMGRFDFSS